MRNLHLPPTLLCLFFSLLAPEAFAQTPVEGYVFEENDRGYLRQTKVTVLETPGNIVRAELETDDEGHFDTALPPGDYRLVAQKDVFHDAELAFSVGKEDVFLKIKMQRKPGYLFDVTIAEARENPDVVVDAVQGAWIEIFNRTQNRSELVLKNHPTAFFQHTFEQGNHYTILVRKPGFLAKRIEIYVNVKGCIICVDGVQSLTPGVTDNLTAHNTMGTLLTNVGLERAKLDKRIQIQNIYYDFDKWDIRPDAAERLDLVVTLMKDNPGLSVELGSHTDCRGDDDYNQVLSQKRAASAVAYIIGEGVDSTRITAKGYGESQLVNRCRNGVPCSEEEHQQNRRTELRITGISGDSLEYLHWPSLEQIIQEEQLAKQKRATKTQQKSRHRPLPEANNSVPPPPVELPPAQQAEATPRTNAIAQESGGNNPYAARALPASFSGYTIEIIRSEQPLVTGRDTVLAQYSPVYVRREAGKRYCYFIGEFKDLAAARDFLANTALPRFSAAQLVEFKNGQKSYVK